MRPFCIVPGAPRACADFCDPTAASRFKDGPKIGCEIVQVIFSQVLRRGRGGRGPRQPLRSLLEHPIPIRDHVSRLLSNPVRAFSMAAARSLPRALPHLASPPLPFQRGGMIRGKPQESLATFPTVQKPTNLFFSESFRKLLAPIYPLTWEKTQKTVSSPLR